MATHLNHVIDPFFPIHFQPPTVRMLQITPWLGDKLNVMWVLLDTDRNQEAGRSFNPRRKVMDHVNLCDLTCGVSPAMPYILLFMPILYWNICGLGNTNLENHLRYLIHFLELKLIVFA